MNANGADRDRTHEELLEALSGYALGALDAADARAVAAHLESCPICRLELEELREAVGLLAFSAPPAMPRPAVKAALLARVERMGAPYEGDGTFTRTITTVPLPAMPPRDAPIALPRPVAPATRPRRRWPYALAAVAAALLLALGSWNAALQGRLRDERRGADARATQAAEDRALVALLNDPTAAHSVTGPARGDYDLPTAGYVYTSPGGTTGLMLTYWLPPLGPDQRFQLWLVKPNGERDSGGLFIADPSGNAHIVIHAPAPFSTYSAVGVTIEPWSGSPRPTGPRVASGPIQ